MGKLIGKLMGKLMGKLIEKPWQETYENYLREAAACQTIVFSHSYQW